MYFVSYTETAPSGFWRVKKAAMTYHYQAMCGVEASTAESVVCPNCNRPLAFRRSDHAAIDACGFESYRFACQECGTPLAGIIDPADETLLLSAATTA